MNCKLLKIINMFLVAMLMCSTVCFVAAATEDVTVGQFGTQAPSEQPTEPITEVYTDPPVENPSETVTQEQTQESTTGASGTFAVEPTSIVNLQPSETQTYILEPPDEPQGNDITSPNYYNQGEYVPEHSSIIFNEDMTKQTRSTVANENKEQPTKKVDTGKYTKMFNVIAWISGAVAVACAAGLVVVNKKYAKPKKRRK